MKTNREQLLQRGKKIIEEKKYILKYSEGKITLEELNQKGIFLVTPI